MTTIPAKAMILAAGRGSRLAPLTDTIPKPLVPVNGKPMIDHVLDKLAALNVETVAINLHYRGDQLRCHLNDRVIPQISLYEEPVLLDTGGGMKNMLPAMGNEAFYGFSGDTLWQDGPTANALKRLADAWDDASMDLLLLLQPLKTMTLTHGTHDYNLDQDKKPVLVRKIDGKYDKTQPYFWFGVRIVHPRLFENTPQGSFSFLDLMIKAEQTGRLGALVHDGECYHISRPQDLADVNHHLQHLQP